MLNGGGGSLTSASVLELRNAMLAELAAADVDPAAPEQLGRRRPFDGLGEYSAVDWIRPHTHVSGASADSQVTLARQLETLEPTVEAVQQGDISFEHALLIARQVSDLPETTVLQAQAELLPAAAKSDPRELRKLAMEIRHREDPEGGARQAYRQHEKRRLRPLDHA